MNNNVMLDLETLSTDIDAAILSIGAYRFDLDGEDAHRDVRRLFYMAVELQDSLDLGLRVDADTVYWWLQQSQQARLALHPDCRCLAWNPDYRWSLRDALTSFGTFLRPGDYLWSHATFDVPILDHAYKRTGIPIPWDRKLCRDCRTFLDDRWTLPNTVINTDEQPNKHDAGWDAYWQAVQLQRARWRGNYSRLVSHEALQA